MAAAHATAGAQLPELPAPAPQEPQAGPAARPVPFVALDIGDALSRAENERKMLLVFWTSESYPDSARMRATTFQDGQLADWVERNAIAIEIDGPKTPAAVAAYKARAYPSVDLYDPLLGLGVERLEGYSSADDLLASFSGALVGGGVVPKPDGQAIEDPYAWLAYANSQWRLADGASEAARAYAWALRNGDTYRPGFRVRYFEFLMRRLAFLKPKAMEALRVMDYERSFVEGKLLRGIVDERTVYELVRIDWWLRKEHRTRETYAMLAGRGEAAELARQRLFRYVVNELGRYGEVDAVLAGLGEGGAVGYVAARLKHIDDNLARQAAGEKLRDEDLDSRSDAVLAASWIYDALLSAGRGRDATELVELIAQAAPSGRAFALFVERALARQQPEVALHVGQRGLEVVNGQQGVRQLRRALAKIPGYIPPPSDDSEGDGDGSGGGGDDGGAGS
ncbi:MAG: hypothetical protein R3F49_00240 [Planctomycetota bacterium]